MCIHLIVYFQACFESCGVDWDGPPPLEGDDDDTVLNIPETKSPLSPSELLELTSLYDPLSACSDYAVSLYLDVLEFVLNQV